MTNPDWRSLALLAICWLAYFALHSALASLTIKRKVAARWPGLMPWYRLGFNLLSALLLLPILWLSYLNPGEILWRWQGATAWLVNGLAAAALLGFWLSLKYYDMEEFLGLRQLRHNIGKVEDQEHFRISPFHRYVRHPWYLFAIIMMWTRDMSATTLLTSILATLYFAIGSRMEERKLLVYHGNTYRRYMARVPGLIPRPWKYLSQEEAASLEHESPAP